MLCLERLQTRSCPLQLGFCLRSRPCPRGIAQSAFALDFRAAKTIKLSERFRLQAIADAFNLTNRANPKHPETTSLLFNFDGTVQSGLGDPRQAQLGLRLMF